MIRDITDPRTARGDQAARDAPRGEAPRASQAARSPDLWGINDIPNHEPKSVQTHYCYLARNQAELAKRTWICLQRLRLSLPLQFQTFPHFSCLWIINRKTKQNFGRRSSSRWACLRTRTRQTWLHPRTESRNPLQLALSAVAEWLNPIWLLYNCKGWIRLF